MSTTSETIYDAKEAEKQLHLDSDEKDAQLTENGREPGANHPEDAVLAIVESATGVRPPVDAHSSSEHEVDGEFTTNYAGGITLILAMVALNLSVFLMFLDNSIIATAIPTITDQFHSTEDIGWYISSYQLALSVLQPTTGKLFTYLRNKWTYIFFLFVFEAGSLICGLANSSAMLIAGRTVTGLGASGLYNGALTIVSASAPLQQRPTIIGALMGFGQLGLIGGPLIGGALTEYSTWRWCFYINLPIGGLSIVMLALVHIPEQRAKPPLRKFLAMSGLARKFDLIGTFILAPAVVMILLALDFGGNDYSWNSSVVIGLLVGSVATFIVFGLWEWRGAGEDGIIPLSLFKQKVIVAACLTSMCLYSVTFISANFIPIYFQSIKGTSAFTSGTHLLPSIIAQLIMAILSGIAVSKLGYYLPWSIVSAVLTSVGCGLITTWSATTTTGEWIGYQIVLGVGRGAGLQMALLAVQTVLPDSKVAVVLAVLVFVQGLGGSIFISVANTILDNSLVSRIHATAPDVDTQAVLAAGATGFRKVVQADEIGAVVSAYATSFDRLFYLATGLSVLMCFTSWGLGWNDVRKKQKHEQSVETPSSSAAEAVKGDANV